MTTPRILVLAPHADDECLGMGGTLAKLVDAGAKVTVAVLTGRGDSATHPVLPADAWDVVRREARAALETLGVEDLRFEELPAVLLRETPAWQINAVVAKLVADVRPTELYVPFPFDMHHDHREIFHAAAVAWRPVTEAARGIRRIAAYEVLSETHWNAPYLEAGFLPHRFVDIGATLERKLAALRCYASQMRPAPDTRSVEAVEALARLRGAQVGMHAAEAFVLVRELA